MKSKFLFAGAAALALAACGDAEQDVMDDPALEDPTAGQTELQTEPMPDANMPTSAQEFADMQASSDMYEIEAGRLAEENGSSQAVQEFGAMMERDHTESTANLQEAAQQADGVTVDPQLTAKHESDLEALRNAGENFDSTYKQQQIAAHQQALDMLQNYASNGDNQALRDFASQTATVVEGHLEQARQLP